eukprot:5336652-Karenia_brevis.AAC.1
MCAADCAVIGGPLACGAELSICTCVLVGPAPPGAVSADAAIACSIMHPNKHTIHQWPCGLRCVNPSGAGDPVQPPLGDPLL